MTHALPLLCVFLTIPEPVVTLHDCQRFPCEWVAVATSSFITEHIAWIDSRRAWAPPREQWEWSQWRLEADELRRVWWNLREARDESGNDDYRLSCLWLLRDRLGPEAYAGGRMPPPCVLARMGRIDR